MVVLAMSAAVLLRGGELLTAEAAVSAILLVSLDPTASDFSFTLNRIFEGLIGGGVALAVSALVFPPDPALHVGRAAQAVFAGLGGALERVRPRSTAATRARARGAGRGARARHAGRRVQRALETGREMARLSPRRRTANAALERYAQSFTEVDFAIRDTRVLARHSVRMLRAEEPSRRRCRARSASSAWPSGRWRAPTTSPSAPMRSAGTRCAPGRSRTKGRPRCWRRSARPRSTCGARPTSRATPASSGPRRQLRSFSPRCDYRGRVRRLTLAIAAALIIASPAHADWNGDGPGDVLAVHPDGRLLLYAGTGTGLTAGQGIGGGWSAFNAMLAPGDFSGDGLPDLLVRTAPGELLMYRGNGAGGWGAPPRGPSARAGDIHLLSRAATSPATAFPTCSPVSRRAPLLYRGDGDGGWITGKGETIGTSWQDFSAILAGGDFSGDGKADVLAVRGSALVLYRGDGAGGWGPNRASRSAAAGARSPRSPRAATSAATAARRDRPHARGRAHALPRQRRGRLDHRPRRADRLRLERSLPPDARAHGPHAAPPAPAPEPPAPPAAPVPTARSP